MWVPTWFIITCFGAQLAYASQTNPMDKIYYVETHHRSNHTLLSEMLNVNCTVAVCEGPLADIYCKGEILATAWYYGMENTCPGTRLAFPAAKVLANFNSLPKPVPKEIFAEYCRTNFIMVPYLQVAELPDWKPHPPAFRYIHDAKLLHLAEYIHEKWISLSRNFTADVWVNQTFYPVVPVPHPFIVPGGRFQVYFYWDSYWILKGLIYSNMFETAKGILLNFAHVIEYHGFIPNSGNIQLSRRSQPPLFAQMLEDYYNATGDKDLVRHLLPLLDKEMSFWKNNRTVSIIENGQNHTFYQYRAISDCPRPESYMDDYQAAAGLSTKDANTVWSSLASACESGIDFSARWFAPNGTRNKVQTNFIVPVDLNVFMARNFKLLAEWHNMFGEESLSSQYGYQASLLTSSIDNVLFSESDGTWFDYNLRTRGWQKQFFPSNIYPLMLKTEANSSICDSVVQYLDDVGALSFPGGIPSSFNNNTREQWDFPNTWAPSVHLFVASLSACGPSHKAYLIANESAAKFVFNVYESVVRYDKIWEKYDVRQSEGGTGSGGEYIPQYGFGWTNGAVLDLIRQFYTNESHISSFPLVEIMPNPNFTLPRRMYHDYDPWKDMSAETANSILVNDD
uniref:Trehalase n=1 Tax=Panagrellus redivivus TaxID=6233 RepID=A0A7E4W1G9_PANRE